MKTILFQGDSITDADRSRTENRFTGSGYPTVAAAAVGVRFPGEYECINRGVSGNRVVDVYARIKEDIINLKPDIMSVLIGVNDVWHELNTQNGVDADKYFKLYTMLIDEVKAALPDIKIIILSPFLLKGEATEEKWDVFRAEVEKRVDASKRVAEKFGLPYVPLIDVFDEAAKKAPDSFWSRDGVHPTAAGHGLIAREWLRVFDGIK